MADSLLICTWLLTEKKKKREIIIAWKPWRDWWIYLHVTFLSINILSEENSSVLKQGYKLTDKCCQTCHPSHRCSAHGSASLFLSKTMTGKDFILSLVQWVWSPIRLQSIAIIQSTSEHLKLYLCLACGKVLGSQESWCTVSSGSESGPLCSTLLPLQCHWSMLRDREIHYIYI